MSKTKPTRSRFLDNWTVREVQGVVLNIARRRRFVWLTKFLLIAIAVGLTALLVILPFVHPVETRFNFTFSNLEEGESENTHMLNPRFQGMDSKGQPFNVLADVAEQEAQDVIVMHNLRGDVSLANGGWISLLSNRGKIELKKKTLDLTQSVNLFSDDGYEMRTETTYIDMKTGEATSSSPVAIQGPVGTLQASGFHINYHTQILTFNGPVRVVIYPIKKNDT